MEPQLIIQALGGLLMALMAFIGQGMRDEMKGMRERLHKVEGGQNTIMAVLRVKGIIPGSMDRDS